MKKLIISLIGINLLLPVAMHAESNDEPQSGVSDTSLLNLPAISASRAQIEEGMWLNLAWQDGWKYLPDDDLAFAQPDFNDSHWFDLNPGGLTVSGKPDTIWNEYGWWRFKFTADSSIYDNPWFLFLYTTGAAEVYMDGVLVERFGIFSKNRHEHKSWNTMQPEMFPPVKIEPSAYHVLAVRFSNHYADINRIFFGRNANWLSFNTGLVSKERNRILTENSRVSARTSGLSVGVLFLLLILHLFLYYRFARDKGSLYVILLLSLLLIHAFGSFGATWMNITGVLSYIVVTTFPVFLLQNIALLPLTLSELFNIVKFRFWKMFALSAVPLALIFTYTSLQQWIMFAYLLVGFVSLASCIYIFIRAYKTGRTGIFYVSAGFIVSILSMILVLVLGEWLSVISFKIILWMVMLIYIAIPVGLTFYIANNYSNLVEGLEYQVAERTKELKQSLSELQSAQTQLIQQEKLASIGELTAGIAHEIQNPLNFVNNFAEVSGEMIVELNEELVEGSKQLAVGSWQSGEEKLELVKEIAMDIKQNLEKINHHGKRADAIVKGMLQHSRTSTGQKEPADINALADEYLRLSYHGLRAKDKTFNANFISDFDPKLPKVKVISQDIGRVLLNLINNAFYAVSERQRTLTGLDNRNKTLSGLETPTGLKTPSGFDYKPTVTVATKNLGDKIEISVKDNGPGIPEEIKNKIFQPFFTTKPTGQGTGLGLSLSYDIVKAHGGELKIDTKENEGTVFTLILPL